MLVHPRGPEAQGSRPKYDTHRFVSSRLETRVCGVVQMRARSVIGSIVPAWAVPAPRLHMETSQPAVHALGRRRALPRSARALSPLVTDVGGEGDCMFGRTRGRRTSTSLDAGMKIGEEGRCDGASPHKHDDGMADATIHQPARRPGTADVVDSRDERVEKKGQVRHRLSPMQVQQQALIRRIRTLETRRDWRGVLAAMVRRKCRVERGVRQGYMRAQESQLLERPREEAHQRGVVKLTNIASSVVTLCSCPLLFRYRGTCGSFQFFLRLVNTPGADSCVSTKRGLQGTRERVHASAHVAVDGPLLVARSRVLAATAVVLHAE